MHEKIPGTVSLREKYTEIIEDLRKQKEKNHHVDNLQRQNKEKLEELEREWSALVLAMREVLITDLEQAKGKMEAQATVEHLLRTAQKCEEEFLSVKHENLKLYLQLPRSQTGLHARKEDLVGEMDRMDFDQMKIENEAYNEKLQECTEDLVKVQKTLPHTEQV